MRETIIQWGAMFATGGGAMIFLFLSYGLHMYWNTATTGSRRQQRLGRQSLVCGLVAVVLLFACFWIIGGMGSGEV